MRSPSAKRVPPFSTRPITWWPGTIAPGQLVNDIVHEVDLFTTFARIGGATEHIPTDRVIDGVDQTSMLLNGDGYSRRDYVFIYSGDQLAATVKGRYKRHWITEETDTGTAAVFYDLITDPRESMPQLIPLIWSSGQFDRMLARHLLWKERYPEFRHALTDPKAVVDERVVSLLLKRAEGYEITETKFYEETTPAHQVMNREGDMVTIPAVTKTHKEVTKKQLAPNMSAIIFWLKNRQPNVWRDRQELTMPDVVGAFKSLAGPDIKALREAKAEVVDVEAEEMDTEDDTPDEGNL